VQFVSLWDDDHRTVDGVALYGSQSLVGLIEGKDRQLGPKINFGSDLEEIPGIGASYIGHAAKLALSPQQAVVVKLENKIQVNLIATTSPFRRLPRAATTTSPLGTKVTARSKSTGGLSVSPPPGRTKRFRQPTMRRAPGRDIYFAVP
jgi:hypothetical protein